MTRTPISVMTMPEAIAMLRTNAKSRETAGAPGLTMLQVKTGAKMEL
jgi:hypothetical protein